ncbi:MAG TPA: AAA family ATPase [Polyangiaceae bacterium]|nr:AAA family ATPase [Polyangiaceae bacterium]
MQIAISVYQQKQGNSYALTPVVPGLFNWTVQSGDLGKARQRLIERVRREATKCERAAFRRCIVPAGRYLNRLHLQLVLRHQGEKRRLTGHFPVVIEERDAGTAGRMRIAYHPLRSSDWFELSEGEELVTDVGRRYSRIFEADDELETLKCSGNEKLFTLRFHVDAPSLRTLLKDTKREEGLAASGVSGQLEALMRVTVNQTSRAASGLLRLGLPRPRERRELQRLLCGPKKVSVLVVGPPGAGKSALLAQAVQDLLDADEYPTHGNLDRVHNVLSLSGKQIIAGMSYVGQWEARCVELLARCKRRKLVLWIDDLPAFASLGRTTVSERVLADFFRGPVARGDLVMLGECSPEQHRALEYEAPGFASAFETLLLSEATPEESLAMLLFESRRLEQELDIAFEPRALRAILEQSGTLYGGTALPGRALAPLKAIARLHAQAGKTEQSMDPSQSVAVESIGSPEVLEFFSTQTGLPKLLLTADAPLTRDELARQLARHVLGQAQAIEAACDLILSLRAQLVGPGRPYSVVLFTGPTGTGKTELAKCLAEYLFGAQERLLRFDMGEFNGPDAVARLIGDAIEPDGLLTSSVRSQPFAVLLFDEIEKAHPTVLNLMLQIFEDARLGDARGNVTDFRHTLIVMTSNLGTGRSTVRGFAEDANAAAAHVAHAVREFFPPELFNRIDRIVPFSTLDEQAAREIVRKELSSLVARPGLGERNVFVRFTEAVTERVTREGYDPEFGARALKRHIEREVGGVLTEALTQDHPAEMRLLWMHARESGQGVGVRVEALREAAPHARSSPVQHLLECDYTELCSYVPAALTRLAAFERDGRLPELGQRMSRELSQFRLGDRSRADQVFNLDALLSHAERLRQRLEARISGDSELQAADRRQKVARGEALTEQDFSILGADAGRRFARDPRRPRSGEFTPSGPTHLGQASSLGRSQALLQELVEVALLEKLLDTAHEGGRHVVLIEVLQLSLHHERRRFSKAGSGLGSWLASSYAKARGVLDGVAVMTWDGDIQTVPVGGLDEALQNRVKLAVLRLVGPGVFDFFRMETGCHVRRTTAAGSEIVRVRVLPGITSHPPDASNAAALEPRVWIREHVDRVKAFERGLEARGPLIENPEQLLPVVRTLRFEPDPEGYSPAYVEDYRFAHVTSRRVRTLSEVLSDFWLLGAALDSSLLSDQAQPASEVAP